MLGGGSSEDCSVTRDKIVNLILMLNQGVRSSYIAMAVDTGAVPKADGKVFGVLRLLPTLAFSCLLPW